MSSHPQNRPKAVTLSDLHPVLDAEVPSLAAVPSLDAERDERRDRAAAAALVEQSSIRLVAAAATVLVHAALVMLLPGRGSVSALLATAACYGVFVMLARRIVRRLGVARPSLVTFLLAGDLAVIFVVTVVSTSPHHYERALLGTMIVVYAANFFFGRQQAWRTLGLGSVAYLALVLSVPARGGAARVEEVFTLLVGVVGAALVVSQSGHVRRRLRTIVTLFERAEQGDFTQTYDEDGDRRFDAITRVGQAYNRVRTQLASMVLTDSLTGCLNRRGFEQALAREVARASRSGSELALLVLDLDHFKQVNDTYGHPAGDEVLRGAGRLLLQAARVGDIVARVGGEEFAILLPATHAEGGTHVADKLCALLRTHPFTIAPDRPPICISTSIGVATVAPRNTRESVADGGILARRADMALYAAKRGGRDQSRVWSVGLETLPA